MSLQWITVNNRLLEASQLTNSIPQEVYVEILNLISSSKSGHLKEEDLSAINEKLKLSEHNLQLLVQSISHILKKSSIVLLKPTKLQKQLVENLKLHPQKAEEFIKVWSNKIKETFGDLNNCKKLDSVSWELNLLTHSSENEGIKSNPVPIGKLQLDLSNIAENIDEEHEKVNLELEESDLLHLYKTLEEIQTKCDAILSK